MDNEKSPMLLEMKNIMKVYGNGIVANKNVNFSVTRGEIHGLLGENGAGKSTLMKILYGIESHEEGEILIEGKPITMNSPLDALANGIGMVHQHFMLMDSLTIAENIVLGSEPSKKGFINIREMIKICNEFVKKYNFDIDCSKKIKDVSVGVKQKVEIVKALYRGVRILILDEPTAILTPQETEELFGQLHKLKESGITIIFISHKLDEIKALCNRITIMRLGKSIGTYNIESLSKEEISNLMVGRDVVLKIDKIESKPSDVILKVRDVSVKNALGMTSVNGVSFDVRRGEILGIAGVEGNGQTELIDALTGFKSFLGDVFISGQSIKGLSVKKIRNLKVGHIPEDRMEFGFAKNISIKENLMVNMLGDPRVSKGIFLNYKEAGKYAEELASQFQVLCYSTDQQVGMLSGGNIQKVVVARELQKDLNLLIANQPTRGVDVGAAEFIKRKIIELRDRGVAVLMVSADLNEVFEVCDSLIVMHKGQVNAYFPDIKALTEMELGEYMLGVKHMADVGGVVFEK